MFFDLDPATLIARIIVLVFAFTIHEFAHAWTATQFGDDTPRLYGRLTLNPLVHLDIMGSLLLILAGFGWAKPVPINPVLLRRRSPAALMWVSLAGPFSNLVLAILAAIPFRLGLVSLYDAFGASNSFFPSISQILMEFVWINLILMIFNLLPIAPLDGEKILEYFAPPNWSGFLDVIRPYGPLILVAVIFIGPMMGFDLIGMIIMPPIRALFGILVG